MEHSRSHTFPMAWLMSWLIFNDNAHFSGTIYRKNALSPERAKFQSHGFLKNCFWSFRRLNPVDNLPPWV